MWATILARLEVSYGVGLVEDGVCTPLISCRGLVLGSPGCMAEGPLQRLGVGGDPRVCEIGHWVDQFGRFAIVAIVLMRLGP